MFHNKISQTATCWLTERAPAPMMLTAWLDRSDFAGYFPLGQTINGEIIKYTLDINTYLTQVLADGTNTYLYGQTRVGEEQPEGWQHHLADALGSVRQLTDADMAVTLAKSYMPFGGTLYTASEGETAYEYTGEIRDGSGLTYLRARYLNSSMGRFITQDPWAGSSFQPISYNLYVYAADNPVMYTDPGGEQWGNPSSGGIGGTVVVCYGVALLIPDPFISEGICTLIAVGLITPIVLPMMIRSAAEVAEAAETIVDENCDIWQQLFLNAMLAHEQNPEPESTPVPQPELRILPTSPHLTPDLEDTPEPKAILYHYTSEEGLLGILSSHSILSSKGEGNRAAYGFGQYFTDISPVEAALGSPYQMSRALFSIPWFDDRVTNFVGINVSG